MDRINGAGHVNRRFVSEDSGTNRPPTEITDAWLNGLQEEPLGVIEEVGLVPSAADEKQLVKAIKMLFQRADAISAAASGTVDAITANFSPAIDELTDGLRVIVRAAGANTVSNPTFTPKAATILPRTVVKGHNQPLAAGDFSGAGFRALMQFDEALNKWVLLNPATGVSGLLTQLIQSLPYPTISSADLCLTVNSAAVAGTGGTVSIGAGTQFSIGEGLGGGLGQLRTFTTTALTSANLTANTTYYLRAQVIAGALVLYIQGGTDSDVVPGSLVGTPNAAAGGGFDSTQLDMLIAKIVTGAAGSAPTVTKLANRHFLTFSVLYTTNVTADGAGGFSLNQSLALNWARVPKITASLGFDITSVTTSGALDRALLSTQTVTRYGINWFGYFDINVSVSGTVSAQLSALGVA